MIIFQANRDLTQNVSGSPMPKFFRKGEKVKVATEEEAAAYPSGPRDKWTRLTPLPPGVREMVELKAAKRDLASAQARLDAAQKRVNRAAADKRKAEIVEEQAQAETDGKLKKAAKPEPKK